MLLPAIMKSILMYGGLVIAGFSLIIFKVLADEKQEQSVTNLPEATIAGKPKKDAYWSWLRWVLLVGGLAISGLMYFKTTDVVLITGDGDEVTAERKARLFGSSDYALAPDHKPPDWVSDPTWVVNRSRFTVKVVSVNYGRTLGFGSDPTVIPPETAAAFSRIDHVGPDDKPPSQVRDEYKLGMDSRYWLTW